MRALREVVGGSSPPPRWVRVGEGASVGRNASRFRRLLCGGSPARGIRPTALGLIVVLASGLAQAEGRADPASCAELASPEPAAFDRLAAGMAAETQSRVLGERLAACGLDYEVLHQRQCDKAYTRQNLEFLLRYCRFEAWSLARAQCERNLDSITPRYAAFCKAFGRE